MALGAPPPVARQGHNLVGFRDVRSRNEMVELRSTGVGALRAKQLPYETDAGGREPGAWTQA